MKELCEIKSEVLLFSKNFIIPKYSEEITNLNPRQIFTIAQLPEFLFYQ